MSHFAVMVITDTPEQLDAALQPYHKYECTGIDDQYVIDVDCTNEVNEWLEKEIFYGKKIEGGVWDYHYNEKDAIEKLDAPKKGPRRQYFEVAGLNVEEEINGWFGYEKRGNQYIGHTNPNKKWDWWVIGGRYSGILRVKAGADALKGRPGLMGCQTDEDGVDQCRVSDLDLDGMLVAKRNRIEEHRKKEFARLLENFQKYPQNFKPEDNFILLDDGFEKWDILSKSAGVAEAALRDAWEAAEEKPAFRDFIDNREAEGNEDARILRQAFRLGYGFFGVTHGKTMQEEIDQCSPLFCTFAVCMDGQWYERGEMGWWACVSNEKDRDVWEVEFKKLLEAVPADKTITIVDCHI